MKNYNYYDNSEDYPNKLLYDIAVELPYYSGFDFTTKTLYVKTYEGLGWRKQKIKNHISVEHLYEHLDGKKIIALPKFKTSKYLIIDIDKRSQISDVRVTDIISQLQEDFQARPFYKELSRSGAHVYFLLDDYIQDSGYSYLINYYKKTYNYVIEPIWGSKSLRFPYSKKYRLNAYSTQDKIADVHDVMDTFRGAKDVGFIPQWLKYHNKEGISIKIDRENIQPKEIDYQNYDNVYTKYTYGAGTRHFKQIEIGLYAQRQGLDYDDFKNLCYTMNDGTSKDMKKSPEKIEKMLQQIWKWSKEHVKETITLKNITTTQKSINSEKRYIDFMEYSFSNTDWEKWEDIIQYHYRKLGFGTQGGKIEKRFINDCITVMESLHSKKLYNKKTKARYTEKNTLNNEKLLKLNKGTLVNYELRQLMGKHLGISNINKVWYFLKKIKAIEPIKISGYTYSYKGVRFAEHFIIHTTRYLYNKLKKNMKKLITTTPIKIKKLNFHYRKKAEKLLKNNIHYKNSNISSYLPTSSGFYKLCSKVLKIPIEEICRKRVLTDAYLEDRLLKARHFREREEKRRGKPLQTKIRRELNMVLG